MGGGLEEDEDAIDLVDRIPDMPITDGQSTNPKAQVVGPELTGDDVERQFLHHSLEQQLFGL